MHGSLVPAFVGGRRSRACLPSPQIAKGEPLLLSYGNLSNDFLFLDYAFTVPDNPHDRVTLRWDLELLEVRLACWRPASRTRTPLHALHVRDDD